MHGEGVAPLDARTLTRGNPLRPGNNEEGSLMLKVRGLVTVACAVMVVVPMPVAAQGSHDIEFHALFPGQEDDVGLDCVAGDAVYDPLRAGRTLQLVDDTDTVVGVGTLEDVRSPSRDGMCETSITFPEVPDAATYTVVAGDQAITSRDKVDLEASGWVMKSMFGTRAEPTPAPTADTWDIEVLHLGDPDGLTGSSGTEPRQDEQDDIGVEDIEDWLDEMGLLSGAVPATAFTGAFIESAWDDSAGEYSTVDGLDQGRGLRLVETYEWSDPRLPAVVTSTMNFNSYLKDPYGLLLVFSNAYRLDGPDGSWTGTATVLWDPDEDDSMWDEGSPVTTVLTGDGAYEGLVAVLRCADTSCDGFVFEDELPPMPSPVQPPTE